MAVALPRATTFLPALTTIFSLAPLAAWTFTPSPPRSVAARTFEATVSFVAALGGGAVANSATTGVSVSGVPIEESILTCR